MISQKLEKCQIKIGKFKQPNKIYIQIIISNYKWLNSKRKTLKIEKKDSSVNQNVRKLVC